MNQQREKVIARDREHLKQLIKETIEKEGPNCDLNFIDVSQVKDMSNLFRGTDFNGDISHWNVSNATDMSGMFDDSPLEDYPPKWYKD